MKPMARKRKDGGEIGKIQMAPMVDVVFQLLIFFLVASEVRPTEGQFQANLPSDGPDKRPAKPETVKDVHRVYLKSLDAEGRTVEVLINGTALGSGSEAFKSLASRLAGIPKEHMRLVIDGDPSVRVEFVTQALDAAIEAQVKDIVFGRPPHFTLPPGGEGRVRGLRAQKKLHETPQGRVEFPRLAAIMMVEG